MASPPFSLNVSVPGNSDIAANFPTLDRTDKDVIQSWLTTQLNSQGRNTILGLDKLGTTYGPSGFPTAPANVQNIYYDNSTGQIALSNGDIGGGSAEILGVPTGAILDFGGSSVPAGYHLCAGQAISRTVFARLFGVIGTTWGAGDGSTTFNVPDLRGMSCFGKDDMGGSAANRITVAGGNINGAVLGNFGFLQTITITQANLPNVNFTVSGITLNDPGHVHGSGAAITQNTQSGTPASPIGWSGSAGNTASHTTGITISSQGTAASGGSGTPFGILPNLVIVNKIIRY